MLYHPQSPYYRQFLSSSSKSKKAKDHGIVTQTKAHTTNTNYGFQEWAESQGRRMTTSTTSESSTLTHVTTSWIIID
jgi:hypothetical protein